VLNENKEYTEIITRTKELNNISQV